MSRSNHTIIRYPRTPRRLVHLFLRDPFGYRRADAIHRCRSVGVHGNLERGIPRDDNGGRCPALRIGTHGTLYAARIARGGLITYAPY